MRPFVDNYDKTRAELDNMTRKIAELQAKREMTKIFLLELRSIKGTVQSFGETMWLNPLDHMTVYSDADIRFTFKNGTEIKAD